MRRRERKALVQKIVQEAFAGMDANNDAARAEAVRSLCPCREPWGISLWDFIFAACQDPSPLVRMEALHVIEDAINLSVPNARGRWLIWKATRDTDPEVRRFAKEKVKVLKRDPRKGGRRQKEQRKEIQKENIRAYL